MTISNEKLQEIVQKDFMDAIFDGDLKRVKLLLAAGITPDKFTKKDKPGDWTPLMHAACAGHFRIVEALINAGANVEAVLIDYDLKQTIYELLDTTVNPNISESNPKGLVIGMKNWIRECVKNRNLNGQKTAVLKKGRLMYGKNKKNC